MAKKSNQHIHSGDGSINIQAQGNVFLSLEGGIPIGLIDTKVNDEVWRLRKARFYDEIDILKYSLALGKSLFDGELSRGNDERRCWGLAWCARLLSRTKELAVAEKFLMHASTLGEIPELEISEAFILSQKGDKEAALKLLAKMDSDASRSGGLNIVIHHDKYEGVIRWMRETGFTAKNLDSEGKCNYLICQLQLGYWEEAAKTVGAIKEVDFEQTPYLHHLTALSKLIDAIPDDFRSAVLIQVPFDVEGFPLASDNSAIEARQVAHKHFVEAEVAAMELDCPRNARIDDEFALWLELRDPKLAGNGMNRLKSKLQSPQTALGFIHYALQFGVKIDIASVERDIDQNIAINGSMTIEAALARYALAFTKSTFEEMASYLALHYSQLSVHLDPKMILTRQVELYSRSGLIDKASKKLDQLIELGISHDEEKNLKRVITEPEGKNQIEFHLSKFSKTGGLIDLINLVVQLEEHNRWDDLCEYGRRLFKETRAIIDAECLVRAYNNTHRSGALIGFLNENLDLLAQSDFLKMSFAWGLYHEGSLVEARSALNDLTDSDEKLLYRSLKINLGISMGDWASLSAHVASEFQKRSERSAHELISVAKLALQLESIHAKDLLFMAAESASDDASLLVAAYSLATNAGWEDDLLVHQWLKRAAELSDEDGPIKTMSLKEIIDQKPESDRQRSDTGQSLVKCLIPMFIGAQSLNQTLINLVTFPAIANLYEPDLRYKSAIPAYSGKRVYREFDLKEKTVALDITALLTLSFLNLLDETLDSFKTVYISHSTLEWLFEEWQKTTFHQPSRIKNARRIRDLIVTDVLERFVPSTKACSELSAQIGEELAALIAEAEKVEENDNVQKIVVRPAPIYRTSSFMEEEVDLSAHVSVMSSCLAVVVKLKQKGQITSQEEERARVYLQLQEKPWHQQPEIQDGAILFLDDLALSYFLHLGLIEKLKNAGLRAVISPKEVSDADALISYKNLLDEAKKIFEQIRVSINTRIESGHIRVGGKFNSNASSNSDTPEHPTLGFFAIIPHCDAVIVDDRFINQHSNIEKDGTNTPVLSTLDLLDALVSNGILSAENKLECRTKLRKAGYIFIPVNKLELEQSLADSVVNDGYLNETAELKAIKESVLQVRSTHWLQMPDEVAWLDGMLKEFIHVLKSLWVDGVDIEEVRVRSDWILEQVDVRGWAQSLVPENADNFIRFGRGQHILRVLTPPSNVPHSIIDAYLTWVGDRVLVNIKERFPDLYNWLVDWYRNFISEIAEARHLEGEQSFLNSPDYKKVKIAAIFGRIPTLIMETLISDKSFVEEYNITAEASISFFPGGISFDRSKLYEAARVVLSGIEKVEVSDVKGNDFSLMDEKVKSELPDLILFSSQHRFILQNYCVLSKELSVRESALSKATNDVNLFSYYQDKWGSLIKDRALNDDELDSFHLDLSDTPVHLGRIIGQEISAGTSSISMLVPHSRRYYERLVGIFDGSGSIREYATGNSRKFFCQLREWKPYEGFLLSLLLSSHSALTHEIIVEHLNEDMLVDAFHFIEKYGDMQSRVGAYEVGIRILPERPEIEKFLLRFVDIIRYDDTETNSSEFSLLSALFILVDGELSRNQILVDVPPYYRRLAALAQAALINRQLVQCGVGYDHFFDWAFGNRGEGFFMQTLADMRTEPRWNPDLAGANQIKADYIGRIINASTDYKDHLSSGKLLSSVFGKEPDSLSNIYEFPLPFLPGPLEGDENRQCAIPDELASIIETKLKAEEVEASSFFALVNLAMVFEVSSDHAKLAAEVLRMAKYRLAKLEDKSQLISILNGLAHVVAISRNRELAEELRILSRRYRHDSHFGLSIQEAIRLCLVASASRKDIVEWRDFVGEWLTELAFGKLSGDEGDIIHSHLMVLLNSVPELWVSSSRAEAALKSLHHG